jgi:lipoprotein signal peptidase
VFNLADSCIMTGGTLMVLLSLRGVRHDGTRDSRAPLPPAP